MTRKTLFASKGLAAAVLGVAVVAQPAPPASLDAANDAWQRGDYITALNEYITQ